MLENIFILTVSLFLIIRSSTFATKYAAELAESFHVSKYIIGFIIVAVISILPETLISINSAIEGVPSFGLGTLLGSNVADLTLVFTIIIYFLGRNIKIENKILKDNLVYPFLLTVPIILGLDGTYSRLEGVTLILIGIVFYVLIFKHNKNNSTFESIKKDRLKIFSLLLVSLIVLLAGTHFTVTSAVGLAQNLGVNSVIIGILIVGLGTVIPELLFSLQAVRDHHESMAVGDLLGTVLADATIVIGILVLINPFSFPPKIVYSTGVFMIAASFILFYFMKSERKISKKEGAFLFIFWLFFVIVEFLLNK